MLENLKLDPIYAGLLFLAESARNPPSLKSHHHVELEINLVVRGAITYVAGGERFTFTQRTLLWMFPAQEHQLVDRTHDAQYYVAVFKPELINSSCHTQTYKGLRRKRTVKGQLLHSVLDPESFDFLRCLMSRTMEGSLDSDILNREAGFGVGSDFRYRHSDPDGLNAGLHHLLLLSWRLQQSGKEHHSAVSLHPSVLRAIEILSDAGGNETLGQLARRCGLSEAHFCRLFASQVGVPFNRYRSSQRLARFWEHYHKPAKSTIMEAVFASGFGSYAQFYKVFADAYGQGPRKILKSKPLN